MLGLPTSDIEPHAKTGEHLEVLPECGLFVPEAGVTTRTYQGWATTYRGHLLTSGWSIVPFVSKTRQGAMAMSREPRAKLIRVTVRVEVGEGRPR